MPGNSPSNKAPAGGAPTFTPVGQHAGKPPMPLSRSVTLIGSRDNARLQLVSSTVSRAHALLVNSSAGPYIRDLASREHTFVNGREIQEVTLKDGDLVKIGRFTFKYNAAKMTGGAVPSTAPAAALNLNGESHPLNNRVILIGRREGADIAIPDDDSVSTSHAVIFEMDGQRFVRDLGSRNGTFVNGQAVKKQQEIHIGDAIRIGHSEFNYAIADAVDELEDLVGTAPLATDALDLEEIPTIDEATDDLDRLPMDIEPAEDVVELEPAVEPDIELEEVVEDVKAKVELPPPAKPVVLPPPPLPIAETVAETPEPEGLDLEPLTLDLESEAPVAEKDETEAIDLESLPTEALGVDNSAPTAEAAPETAASTDIVADVLGLSADEKPLAEKSRTSSDVAELQPVDEAPAEEVAPLDLDFGDALEAPPAEVEAIEPEPEVEPEPEIELKLPEPEIESPAAEETVATTEQSEVEDVFRVAQKDEDTSDHGGATATLDHETLAADVRDDTAFAMEPLDEELADTTDLGLSPQLLEPAAEAKVSPPLPTEPEVEIPELKFDDLPFVEAPEPAEVVAEPAAHEPEETIAPLVELSQSRISPEIHEAEEVAAAPAPVMPTEEELDLGGTAFEMFEAETAEEESHAEPLAEAPQELIGETEPTPESAFDLDDAVAPESAAEIESEPAAAEMTDSTFGRAVDEFSSESTGPIVEEIAPAAFEHAPTPEARVEAEPLDLDFDAADATAESIDDILSDELLTQPTISNAQEASQAPAIEPEPARAEISQPQVPQPAAEALAPPQSAASRFIDPFGWGANQAHFLGGMPLPLKELPPPPPTFGRVRVSFDEPLATPPQVERFTPPAKPQAAAPATPPVAPPPLAAPLPPVARAPEPESEPIAELPIDDDLEALTDADVAPEEEPLDLSAEDLAADEPAEAPAPMAHMAEDQATKALMDEVAPLDLDAIAAEELAAEELMGEDAPPAELDLDDLHLEELAAAPEPHDGELLDEEEVELEAPVDEVEAAAAEPEIVPEPEPEPVAEVSPPAPPAKPEPIVAPRTFPTPPPPAKRLRPSTPPRSTATTIPPYNGESPTESKVTTGFDGLAMPPVREMDVFSQMPAFGAAAINDELPAAEPQARRPVRRGRPAQQKPEPWDAPLPDDSQTPAVKPTPRKAPQQQSVPPAPPRKKRRWFGLGGLLLLMLLTMGIVAGAIFFFTPDRWLVSGTLRFKNFDSLTQTERQLQEANQRTLLANENVHNKARDLAMIARVQPGFLSVPSELSATVSRVHFSETEMGDLVIPYPGRSREDDRKRVKALLDALYDANSAMIAQTAQLRSQVEANTASRTRNTATLADIKSQLDAAAKTAATLAARQHAVTAAEAEFAKVERDYNTAVTASAALKANVDLMKQDAPAAVTAAATQPATDTQIAQMQGDLTTLNEEINKTKTARADKAKEARTSLDTAMDAFQKQISDAQKGMKDHPELATYVGAAEKLQDQTKELTDQMIKRQQEQYALLNDLRTHLNDQMEGRRSEAWKNDPQLKEYTESKEIKTRQYNTAVGQGLKKEAEELKADLDLLDKMVKARQTLVGDDTIVADTIDRLTKIIDTTQHGLEDDRRRTEKMLDDMQKTFAASKPAVEKLPAEQKQLASEMEKKLTEVNDARKQYTEAADAANAAMDAELQKMQASATELAGRISDRRKEITEQITKNTNEEQAKARQLALTEKTAQLAAAQMAQASGEKMLSATRKVLNDTKDQLAEATTAQKRVAELTVARDKADKELKNIISTLEVKSQALSKAIDPIKPTEQDIRVTQIDNNRPMYALAGVGAVAAVFAVLILVSAGHESRDVEEYGEELSPEAFHPIEHANGNGDHLDLPDSHLVEEDEESLAV